MISVKIGGHPFFFLTKRCKRYKIRVLLQVSVMGDYCFEKVEICFKI